MHCRLPAIQVRHTDPPVRLDMLAHHFVLLSLCCCAYPPVM
jgi:hypothetical protein